MLNPDTYRLSADASAHIDRIYSIIAESVAEAGGVIPFSAYMQQALYAPGLGYYAAGAEKFGERGDFVTAPLISPLFARSMARYFAPILQQTKPHIIELGAGTGKLAAELLVDLERLGVLPERYQILELSPDLKARQKASLMAHAPQFAHLVSWIDSVPERWSGIVFGNEVLDAVPCEIVKRQAGQWQRGGVRVDDAAQQFTWADLPLTNELKRLIDERIAPQLVALSPSCEYVTELNPGAEALVATLAERSKQGVMLWIDYGFPRKTYYHPDRSEGTLMCHRAHHSHANPFDQPGLTDITAHIDFTAIAEAATAAGMDFGGYATQAGALMQWGILDELGKLGDVSSVNYIEAAAGVQKLLSPAEMGEFFKVISFGRGVDAELMSFGSADQSFRL